MFISKNLVPKVPPFGLEIKELTANSQEPICSISDLPEVKYKDSGERNHKVKNCRSNGEVERSLVQVPIIEGHAAPGGLRQVLPLVADVVHLGKHCPRKSRHCTGDPDKENHPPGPANTCPGV